MSDRSAHAILRHALLVWAGLAALLLLTLALAYVPMGRASLPVSLGIAAAKALLVALGFMELRRAEPLLRLAAGAALLWIGFLFTLSFADWLTRPVSPLP